MGIKDRIAIPNIISVGFLFPGASDKAITVAIKHIPEGTIPIYHRTIIMTSFNKIILCSSLTMSDYNITIFSIQFTFANSNALCTLTSINISLLLFL